jgi:hypothetical protein
MFVKKKKNRSGSTSVVVASKHKGIYKEPLTIGISSNPSEINCLVEQGRDWIGKQQAISQPYLDLFGEESEQKQGEIAEVERLLSQVSNVLINGTDLILNRVFDRIGFNDIQDGVLRKSVLSRLSYPAGKAATVE